MPALRSSLRDRVIDQAIEERIPPDLLNDVLIRINAWNDSDTHAVCLLQWWHGRVEKFQIIKGYVEHRVKISQNAQFQGKGMPDPLKAMRGSLSARAELHHFRLNKHFPKRIKEVELEMTMDRQQIVIVQFHNGHVAKARETDVMSTDFLALCAMLYDLPPKSE